MKELVGMLTSQLGVNDSQAEGGAGLLFKFAKDQLGGDFSQVASALPGVMDLIGKAPASDAASGGLAGLAGAAMSAFGAEDKTAGLLSMAGAFKSLDLDMDTVMKFAPVVMGFVKTQGGEGAFELLSKVLK